MGSIMADAVPARNERGRRVVGSNGRWSSHLGTRPHRGVGRRDSVVADAITYRRAVIFPTARHGTPRRIVVARDAGDERGSVRTVREPHGIPGPRRGLRVLHP